MSETRTNAEIAASMREQLSAAFIEQASGLRSDINEVVQRVFEAGLAESNARLERESDALRRELEQEKIWKQEDPRMLREQIRVADVAFNFQRAKLAAAQKDLESLRNAVFALCGHLPGVSQEEQLAVAQKEIEELKRDKERLDWLQGFQGDLEMWPLGGPLNSDKTNFNIHARGVGFLSESDDVRTAIDSAIAQAKAHV